MDTAGGKEQVKKLMRWYYSQSESIKPASSMCVVRTSLERARAAGAAVLAGAGGGVRAADGGILLSGAGRLLGAGRLVGERTAAQQGGFLQDGGTAIKP